MGKSSAVSDLLQRMSSRFDLVIGFIGSANCNPVLKFLMEQHWDDRFFFDEWKTDLVDRLMKQQESHKRNVLILMDDVILSSQAQDQICHLAMRGRHFNISLMMCTVSYTTMPKRMRRSLDALLVFSCPMQGDMKILCWEYANNTSMATFALNNLEEHHCLVLETLERRQKLFLWKANLLELENIESPGPVTLRTSDGSECSPEPHSTSHPIENVAPSNRTESTGGSADGAAETVTDATGPRKKQKSRPLDP